MTRRVAAGVRVVVDLGGDVPARSWCGGVVIPAGRRGVAVDRCPSGAGVPSGAGRRNRHPVRAAVRWWRRVLVVLLRVLVVLLRGARLLAAVAGVAGAAWVVSWVSGPVRWCVVATLVYLAGTVWYVAVGQFGPSVVVPGRSRSRGSRSSAGRPGGGGGRRAICGPRAVATREPVTVEVLSVRSVGEVRR